LKTQELQYGEDTGKGKWVSAARWVRHVTWSTHAVPGSAIGKAGASSGLLATSRSCKRLDGRTSTCEALRVTPWTVS